MTDLSAGNPPASFRQRSRLFWQAHEHQTPALAFALTALACAIAVLRVACTHSNWMYFEQDDFFYYLKIAANLAAGHGSTFNGLVATNGYHPLWMLTLAAAVRAGFTGHRILWFLAAVTWLACMVTFLCGHRILRRAGVSSAVSAALATILSVYSAHVFFYGMEVTLAVPLLLVVITLFSNMEAWSRPGAPGTARCCLLGLACTAAVLARLDVAIWCALLVVLLAAQPALRARIRAVHLAGFAAGLLPLALFFVLTHHWFGVWLPVSGMAKQLKVDHGFTSVAWASLFDLHPGQFVNFAPIFAGLLLLPFAWRHLPPVWRALCASALLFPFVYATTLSWSSDWPVWGWYAYVFRPAWIMGCAVCLSLPAVRRLAQPAAPLLLLLAFAMLVPLRWFIQQPDIVDAATELQAFAATRPGTYAMGDRSGAVGMLLPDPVVQTEGLVMDRAFLQELKAQKPLLEVLHDHHVSFYVASTQHSPSGCFHAVEPAQAGPHSRHMRGDFCAPPLAQWSHGSWHTLVFAVPPATAP